MRERQTFDLNLLTNTQHAQFHHSEEQHEGEACRPSRDHQRSQQIPPEQTEWVTVSFVEYSSVVIEECYRQYTPEAASKVNCNKNVNTLCIIYYTLHPKTIL